MKKIAWAIPALLAGASVAAAGPVGDAAGVKTALTEAGYADVRDVEKDDGLWEAEVRGDDGKYRDVYVIAETGEILDAQSGERILTAEEVIALLEAEGYADVRDLDLEDALWEAEVRRADGTEVDLRINGFSGQVLSVENDD
jgi:uncharacterized membrane protein YkoI